MHGLASTIKILVGKAESHLKHFEPTCQPIVKYVQVKAF